MLLLAGVEVDPRPVGPAHDVVASTNMSRNDKL